ncbi:catechol 2,3-dioxygenase [Deinobacterium chartae]|uniref:Catechol 2,3-dioxygenase n=1 Tax=Deinobacterium chartae TaxID=521158 RepID=A0A841I0J6_9DEIO|nr:VOC family protein [Deinobacterium chartae]MBB6099187.1 catechol 2,3-dioxygenase [Deinobacterium chartae]
MNPTPPTYRLPAPLTLGPVELSVASLERSLNFYQQVLGLQVIERRDGQAQLGVPGRMLLILTELPGALPAPARSSGLYHFALLLPSRADLARFVRHLASTGVRVGLSDHWVSEAFYLNDPDGHGIEVYRDRPRSEWRYANGQPLMGSDPIDVPGLLREAGTEAFWAGLPAGTVMGHVHLRVSDLRPTRDFYHGVLGLDIVTEAMPGALFVATGGYHHHFGLNVWHSQGGRPAPQGSARLERVWVNLSAADLEALCAHLSGVRWPYTLEDGVLELRDPAGNLLAFCA